MGDDDPGSPLRRRVPGATGVGPPLAASRVLPDSLIARMRAAVDAAHAVQGTARAVAAAEPVTESMPSHQVAVAAQDWPMAGSQNGAGQRGDAWSFRLGTPGGRPPGGLTEPREADALDDMAESYLVADPDLTAGYLDDVGLDDARPDPRRLSLAVTTSGWDALRRDAEPGADVGPQRAAWWDHAVQSGRPGPTSGPGPPPRVRASTVRVGVVALVVVLAVGGVAALALASRDHASNTKVGRSSDTNAASIKAARLASDVASAAAWVAAQVNRTTKVACDPVTCQALAGHGYPGQQLIELGRRAASPFSATVVVDTPTLRRQFGPSLAASWAPTVLAGFGLGADRITVRVLAHSGAQAYMAALRADRRRRQAVGIGLLASSQVTTSQAARRALAGGDVDDRLLLVITALASQHPIDLLAFGRMWSGASPGIPMRAAYLADYDPAAYLTEAVYVQEMMYLLRAQPLAYRPVHFGMVWLAGRRVLSIWFPAPSPLGLISATP